MFAISVCNLVSHSIFVISKLLLKIYVRITSSRFQHCWGLRTSSSTYKVQNK